MSELNLGPEKTILTYDGVKYVKQIVQEILTEDGIPTGHFFRHIERSGDPSILVPTIPDDESGGSSPSPGGSGGTPPSTDEEEDDTVLTILGTYLDNDDNYKKFKEDFYDFIKMKVGLINYNPYVHLIVGDSQVFSLQHSIAVNTV
jgi:hypothetical protein